MVLAELGSVHVRRQASQDWAARHLGASRRTGREVWQAMRPLRERWAAMRGGHGHGGGSGGRRSPDWHPQTLDRRDGGLFGSSVRVKSGERDGRVQRRKRDCPRPWLGISWGTASPMLRRHQHSLGPAEEGLLFGIVDTGDSDNGDGEGEGDNKVAQ